MWNSKLQQTVVSCFSSFVVASVVVSLFAIIPATLSSSVLSHFSLSTKIIFYVLCQGKRATERRSRAIHFFDTDCLGQDICNALGQGDSFRSVGALTQIRSPAALLCLPRSALLALLHFNIIINFYAARRLLAMFLDQARTRTPDPSTLCSCSRCALASRCCLVSIVALFGLPRPHLLHAANSTNCCEHPLPRASPPHHFGFAAPLS